MSVPANGILETLEEARAAGYLGPGPVQPHIDHARGFVACAQAAGVESPACFADLGSGGGVPGLVCALAWPEACGILIESSIRRAEFLRDAVQALGLGPRVEVVAERAEVVARAVGRRETFAVLTARGFAEPAVTAEIAAGLVRVGGVLVVSEPPEPDPRRWPAAALADLGFDAAVLAEAPGGGHFAIIRKNASAPANAPRGVGKPGKRPLW